MPDLTIYAAQSAMADVRLARAVAAELPSWNLSRILMAGLRLQLRYMATYYPDAMERARKKVQA